ncbi:MAG: penicillin-binding protein 2 [Elusimicrobiota bacterium]
MNYKKRYSTNRFSGEKSETVKNVNLKKLRFIRRMTLFAFFCISLRLFYVQVVQFKHYRGKADDYTRKKEVRFPIRGSILDRNNQELALSLSTYSCKILTNAVRDAKESAEVFSKCLNLDYGEVYKKISDKSRRFVYLKKQLLPEECRALDRLDTKQFKCLQKENTYRRFYPNKQLAQYVVGYMKSENPSSGIELCADEILSGAPVKQMRFRDALGNDVGSVIPIEKTEDAPHDVVVTIDKKVQYIAERELAEGMRVTRSKKGIVVVQEPFTGEILALACLPSYSPEDVQRDSKVLNNPAISHVFEPGSVFKAITFSALLEEGKLDIHEKVFCENGKWEFHKTRIISDHEKKGALTAQQVMEVSSNIGTAKLSLRLNKNSFYEYICMFGFNVPTGIFLPGESGGLLEEPKRWRLPTQPTLSFGQEIAVTAIQVLNAYSVLANGGVLMEPQILKEIRCSETDKVVWSGKPVRIRRVISAETCAVVTSLLESVVQRGTGIKAQVPGYRIAGKTGTAQKYEAALKRYSDTKYNALFCGFLPVEKARAVIVVVLDEPAGYDHTGGSVAGPIFARIAQKLMEYWNISPDGTYVEQKNKMARKQDYASAR